MSSTPASSLGGKRTKLSIQSPPPSTNLVSSVSVESINQSKLKKAKKDSPTNSRSILSAGQLKNIKKSIGGIASASERGIASTSEPSSIASSSTSIAGSSSTSIAGSSSTIASPKSSKHATRDNAKKAISNIVAPRAVSLSISTANTKPKINIKSSSPISPSTKSASPKSAISKGADFITSAVPSSLKQPPALAAPKDTKKINLPEPIENPDVFTFIKYLPPLSPSQKFQNPVLPKKTRSSPKLTVVLDLDETLVHCNTQEGIDASLTFPVNFNGIDYIISGNLRPHCIEFLQKCSERYEIVLFTASQKIYADQLATIIDPNHTLFKYRLFRDSCTFVSGNYLKDLDSLGRDLSRTVIVDNSPQAFGYHINNGIPIKSWYEDKKDTELLKVFDFLQELELVDDVRPLIRSTFGLEDLIYSNF